MSLEHVIGWTLVHSLWEIAAIALALQLATLAAKRAGSSVRYAVALVAMILCIALPLVTAFRLGVHSTTPTMELAAAPAPTMGPIDMSIQPPLMTAPQATDRVEEWMPIVVRFWLLGLLVMCVRLGGGYLTLARTRRRQAVAGEMVQSVVGSLAKRMGISTPSVLLVESQFDTPAVIGAFKAAVLLPLGVVTKLSPPQLEAVIAHELAHIKRYDYVVNLVQLLLEAILFYHPAFWWISHRVRAEREHCCDDIAVALTGSRSAYVEALLTLEQSRTPRSLALAATGGELLDRVRRLLGAPRSNRLDARITLPAVLVTVLLAAGLAHRVMAQNKQPGDVQVDGVVLNTDGTPASGAKLRFNEVNRDTLAHDEKFGTADVTGRFHFVLDHGDLGSVTAVRSSVWMEILSPKPGESILKPTIRLPKSQSLRVKVVDQNGRALPGVGVVLEQAITGFRVIEDSELFKAFQSTSDQSGWATVKGLPVNSQVRFTTVDKSLCATDPRIRLTPDLSSTTIHLQRSCTLDGTLTLDGKPVTDSGAAILVFQGVGEGDSFRSVRVEPSGHYHLDQLRSGQTSFGAALPAKLAKEWIVQSGRKDLVPGIKTSVDLALTRGCLVHGTLKGSGTEPVNVSTVNAFLNWSGGLSVLPGQSFQMCVPRNREMMLRASLHGWNSIKVLDTQNVDSISVTLDAPTPGPKFEVSVLDQNGKPTNAYVRAGYSLDHSDRWEGQSTDGNGHLTFYPQSGASLDVTFQAEANGQMSDVFSATGGDVVLRLHKVNTVTLRGHVVDEHDRPISGASVQLRTTFSYRAADDMSQVEKTRRLTDQNGRFAFSGLVPGDTIDVSASAAGYVGTLANGVQTKEGQDISMPPIWLVPGASIRGRAVDQNGKPLADAEVFTHAREGLDVSKTDENGNFTTPLLPLGENSFTILKGSKDRTFTAKTGSTGTYVLPQ